EGRASIVPPRSRTRNVRCPCAPEVAELQTSPSRDLGASREGLLIPLPVLPQPRLAVRWATRTNQPLLPHSGHTRPSTSGYPHAAHPLCAGTIAHCTIRRLSSASATPTATIASPRAALWPSPISIHTPKACRISLTSSPNTSRLRKR